MTVRFNFCIVVAVLLIAGGCAKKNYLNENDALRAKVIDLQKQVDDLNRRSAELESQLRQATASATAPGEITDEVRLATPHPVSISIGKLSHVAAPRATSDSVSPSAESSIAPSGEKLLVYVDAVDGRGRSVQIVGTVELVAFRLPMTTDPAAIGRLTATPLQVRDAYRATVLGAHYTFDVPLTESVPTLANASSPETVLVKVQYTDGLTGEVLTAERSLR